MSGPRLNAINLNVYGTSLEAFGKFVTEAYAKGDKNAVCILNGKTTLVSDVKPDKKAQGSAKIKASVNKANSYYMTNELFRQGIADYFGGEEKIPEEVLNAMQLDDDFDVIETVDDVAEKVGTASVKPLKARNIKNVLMAIQNATQKQPEFFAKNIIGLLTNFESRGDVDIMRLELQNRVNFIYDQMFPKALFDIIERKFDKDGEEIIKANKQKFINVDEQKFITIFYPDGNAPEPLFSEKDWPKLANGTPKSLGRILRDAIQEKMRDVVNSFSAAIAEGCKSTSEVDKAQLERSLRQGLKDLSNIIMSSTALLDEDPEYCDWCKKVVKEIDSYYMDEVKAEPAEVETIVAEVDAAPDLKKQDAVLLNKFKENPTELQEIPDDQAKVEDGITTTALLKDKIRETNPCKENPFMRGIGGTTAIIEQLVKEHPELANDPDAFMVAIAADDRLCGGLISPRKINSTQEETLIRQINFEKFWNSLKNYVHYDDEQKKLIYNDGANELHAANGYSVDVEITMSGLKKMLENPIQAAYLFCAMPSMTWSPESFDPRGNLFYMTLCRTLISPDKALTPQQIVNFCKLRDYVLYEKAMHSGGDGHPVGQLRDEQFKELMMLLMFANDNKEFDIFGNDTIAQAEKLAALISSGKHTKLLAQARKNYLKTIGHVARGWAMMANQRKAKYFIGMAFGCKSFKNDVKDVARVIAREFVQYGGNTKFLYAQYRPDDIDKDNNVIVNEEYDEFRKAFEEAYSDLQAQRKNAFRAGYDKQNALIPDANVRNNRHNQLLEDNREDNEEEIFIRRPNRPNLLLQNNEDEIFEGGDKNKMEGLLGKLDKKSKFSGKIFTFEEIMYRENYKECKKTFNDTLKTMAKRNRSLKEKKLEIYEYIKEQLTKLFQLDDQLKVDLDNIIKKGASVDIDGKDVTLKKIADKFAVAATFKQAQQEFSAFVEHLVDKYSGVANQEEIGKIKAFAYLNTEN